MITVRSMIRSCLVVIALSACTMPATVTDPDGKQLSISEYLTEMCGPKPEPYNGPVVLTSTDALVPLLAAQDKFASWTFCVTQL